MAKQYTKHYLDLDSVQLHYLEAGPTAGTPLLMLHQVPSSSAMWEAVIPLFAERGYRVLAFDLPGYGMSDPVKDEPGTTELTDYAQVFADVLVALDATPAFIVGHHTGAAIALEMSAFHSESVRGAAVWGVPALTPEFSAELAAEPPPAYGPDFIDDVVEWWTMRSRYSREDLIGPVMARSLREMVMSGLHRGRWA